MKILVGLSLIAGRTFRGCEFLLCEETRQLDFECLCRVALCSRLGIWGYEIRDRILDSTSQKSQVRVDVESQTGDEKCQRLPNLSSGFFPCLGVC